MVLLNKLLYFSEKTNIMEKTNIFTLFFILSICLIGCGENELNSTQTHIDTLPNNTPDSLVSESTLEEERHENEGLSNSQEYITFKMDNILIRIDGIVAMHFNPEHQIHFQGDTAYVDISLGDDYFGQSLHISKNGKYKVYQKYFNSATINYEGPHCDMINWKKYESEWELLKNQDSIYQTLEFNNQEYNKFVDVNEEELIKGIIKHCGDHWLERAKEIKKMGGQMYDVGLSHILYKIEFENKEINTKYICLNIPMGC